MSVFLQELRYAVRSLRKSPGFAGRGDRDAGPRCGGERGGLLDPARGRSRAAALPRARPARRGLGGHGGRPALASRAGHSPLLAGARPELRQPRGLRRSDLDADGRRRTGVAARVARHLELLRRPRGRPVARPRLSARGRDRGSGSGRRPEPCALGLAFRRRPVGPGPASRARETDVHGRRRHAAGAVSRLGPDDRQARLRRGRATVLRAREPRGHRGAGRPELRARSDRASPRRHLAGGRPDRRCRRSPGASTRRTPRAVPSTRVSPRSRKRPRARCGPPSGSSSARWDSSSRSAARTSRASSSPARRPAGGSSRSARRWARAAAEWRRRSCSSRCSSPRRPASLGVLARGLGAPGPGGAHAAAKCPRLADVAPALAASSLVRGRRLRRGGRRRWTRPGAPGRAGGTRSRRLSELGRGATAAPAGAPRAAPGSCSARPRSPSCSPRARSC